MTTARYPHLRLEPKERKFGGAESGGCENLKHLRPSSTEFFPEANDGRESGGHLGDRDGRTGHTALATNLRRSLTRSFFLPSFPHCKYDSRPARVGWNLAQSLRWIPTRRTLESCAPRLRRRCASLPLFLAFLGDYRFSLENQKIWSPLDSKHQKTCVLRSCGLRLFSSS